MEKVLILASGLCAVLAFLLGRFFRGRSEEKTAVVDGKMLVEVKHEIENTPSSDLVDAAPNADELRADAAAIAGKFRQRLRDRAGNVLSGDHGAGADGGG